MRGSTIVAGQRLLIPGRADPRAIRAATPVAAAEPTAEPSTAPPAAPAVHTVRSGDTLWGIARQHGVTVPELAAANGIDTQTRLALGTRLTIPASSGSYTRVAAAAETTRVTYHVQRGDTLSQIAERFKVTIRQLMGWNDLRSPRSLRAGQRLILYVDPSRFSGG
jgi:membrane-bound lytic murein transglycosylase D